MFNSKQSEKAAEGFSINSLGTGSSIKGDIVAVSDIRIAGTITGNIDCSQRVIVGESGQTNGDIKCKAAIIEGHVKGKLQVVETLEVHSKANIEGEIFTSRLVVENGAIFNVQCTMTSGKAVEKATGK